MSTSANALLGILFVALALLATALMYQYWGYPYDKEKRKSACPQWKMNIHRAVGFAYVIVYLLLMWQMVPRLWNYQVEFPARTVAHIMLGISIGVILLVKISILRFWRHFEEWMPVLGTALLLCTFLLLGLSLPFVYKERKLAAHVGGAFSEANRARVAELLPGAGFPDGVDLAELASEGSLRAGRRVLLDQCVQCHDLKTVIARPRVPADWFRTVQRMTEKPTLGDPITDREQHQVTAYLIAITPDLQRSVKEKRDQQLRQQELLAGTAAGAPAVDPAAARAAYEDVCSQCHDLSDVDEAPPRTDAQVDEVIQRMIDNGLEADPARLDLVRSHLRATFVRASPAPAPDGEDGEAADDDGDDDDDDEDDSPSIY